MEAALSSFTGVRDAAAFAVTTPVGVAALGTAVVWRGEADMSGLREHLRRRLPPGFVPKFLVAVDSVPRNASGKIDRTRLKEMAGRRASEL